MNQILINPLERVGGSTIKEITIGELSLKTVQTIPKIQTKSEVSLLSRYLSQLPSFDGITLDLWSLPTIYSGVHVNPNQLRLDDAVHPTTAFRKMLNKKILFIDPNTEWYKFRFSITNTETRQTRIFDQRNFPQNIRDIFLRKGYNGHDIAWREMGKRTLSFVSWHIDQYLKYGANLIIPPSPLIDGSSPSMLKIARRINLMTRKLVFETTDAYCSIYFSIHPNTFKEEQQCNRILESIKKIITPNSMLILKFFRVKNVLDNAISRQRLRNFLLVLDELKRSLQDQLAIMVLDTKNEGLAYMGNGVDITCDPLGDVSDIIQRRAKKKEEISDRDPSIEQYNQYGKYFHPDTREYTKIKDLIGMIGPKGFLPHNCHFCKQLHGRLLNHTTFPSRDEWNFLRRLHNFSCRREEDNWLTTSISNGEERAIEIYLGQQMRGNKNLVDLLP